MVFEAIVADVLNRFLGDYVENLDRSQLKIGIWGGDVVLENLILKQNALEELNIPVQTVYGHLGKLVLKIPWKNLYGASVEASIEKLFLIVNPTAEVKYDPEKEEKMALASKQSELARVEEAKKKEAEKDQTKVDDSFVEKLVAQIIKNVQLKIKDIHIRYEDTITNPKAPFSCGISLHNLSVHTTDDSWRQTVIQEAVTKIYKILSLEGLAVYWNANTKMYSKMDQKQIVPVMQNEIATKSKQPNNYQYMLGPINSTAKLILNMKPETDEPSFSIPKLILTLHMEQLMVCINKAQYQDLMRLADSMDRMTKGAPYRKYRPFLKSYRGHYKEWWKFAYKCVAEEEVRRRRRNWDWEHISQHRNLCKAYANAYHNKLCNKGKCTPVHQDALDLGEKRLDLFNLVVIRQRIEMEVARAGKQEEEAKKSRGWFGGWFGGQSAKQDDEASGNTAIIKQFQNAMTPEEKAKLFRAIDYHENSAPLHMPEAYVAVDAHFKLDSLQVAVTDGVKQVVCAMIDDVEVGFRQRPGGNAMKVEVQMHQFNVLGVKQGELVPNLVTSKDLAAGDNLLNVTFETNPLTNDCGQRVQVSARPLQMVYDAQTVIEIVNVFKPPEETATALAQLQAVAGNKLSDLKEKSALGMQYAVSQHTYIDINVDVASSYIIVPQGGIYTEKESCLVVKLGAISIKSEPRSQQALDVHKMFLEGLADEDILRELIQHTYDKLVIGLTEMQIVISGPTEDWKSAIMGTESTSMHLLQPTTLKIQIHKCLITNDPRLPNVKVMGELEQIAINASEDRLLTLLEVIVSMPLPQSNEPVPLKESGSKSSNLSLFKYLDPAEKKKREAERKPISGEQSIQLTQVEAYFVMKELTLNVCRKTVTGASDDRLLSFCLQTLELTATQKTFTLETVLRLEAISLEHYRPTLDTIRVVETPQTEVNSDGDRYLLTITYTNVDKRCPDFRGHYGSVEQLIVLDFTTLKLLLHLEGLKQLLVTANDVQQRIAHVQGEKDRIATAGPLETIMEDTEVNIVKSKVSVLAKKSKRKQIETIQLKVQTNLKSVNIRFATDARPLADACISGLHVGLIMKQSYMQVDCTLQDIGIIDLNPETIHTQILKVLGGDVVNVRTVIYNLEQFPNVSDTDISIDAELNCLRIVFLNWFVTSMLDFLNNFQAAQQAIIDASSEAVDAARANVQNAYKNSTKVSLKVKLSAPIIIAPANSKSNRAVVVDLGQMTMNNKFFDLDVETSRNNKVTVDELTLALENMKVSTVKLLDEGKEFDKERMLLSPTSFSLLVKRSLSGWYEALPDLDISGRLKTIAITVGHSDFKMIMSVLNQNLKEGQVPKETVVKVPSSPTHKFPKVTTKASMTKTRSSLSEGDKSESQKQKTPRITMKFTFTMDCLMIDLVNTTEQPDKINASMTSLQDVGLARFCLALLSVKGRLLSDDSMHTSVLLVDCTLDDLRPGRGAKITRYFERRAQLPENTEVKDKIRSMIDVTYTMKKSDTFIDVRIFSFNLILAVDFLMKVAEFVTSGMAMMPAELEAIAKSQTAVIAAVKTSDTAVVKVKPQTSNTSNEPSKPSMMTVNIKVEQPDIILVESLEDKDCDALIMNTEVTFKLRTTEDRMVMDGAVSGLQLFTRPGWVGGGGDAPVHFLLEPCSLSLAAAQPQDSGMHIDLVVSNIKINVSPETIGLLNRVLVTMTKSEDCELEDEGKKIYVYHDLWTTKPFKHNDYWFLKTEIAQDALTANFEAEPLAVKPLSGEICLLSSPSITVSLEMSIGTETIPILVMQAGLSAQIRDWSSELNLESTWAMQVMYYNITRALWEPLVEPVEVLRDNQYKHLPWELKLEVLMRSDDQLSSVDMTDEAAVAQAIAQAPPKKSVTLSSTETLELTVTSTCMDVLTQLGNAYSAAMADTPDASVLDRTRASVELSQNKNSGAPYVLHNCTGLTVHVLLNKNDDFAVFKRGNKGNTAQDYRASDREVVLEAGAAVPLQLKRAALNLLTLDDNLPQFKLHIKIVEQEDEICIPVERADKRYFPLGRRGPSSKSSTLERPGAETQGLISEVTMHDGAMNIYLRSAVQVRNTLSEAVCVYYMTASGNEVRSLGNVSPGEVLRLPLQAAHTPTAEIFFSVEGFTVSVSPFIWKELQQEVKISKLLQCDSKDKTCAEKFYIRAVGSMEQVYLEDTNRHTLASTCYDIVLKPAIKMQNCLPVDIVVSQLGLKRTQVFQPGEMFQLSNLAPDNATIVVMLQNYMEKCWTCTKKLPETGVDLSVWSFDSHDSPAVMTLDLGLHNVDQDGTVMLSLYCPFWMLNKTGLTLAYRKSSKKNDKETSNSPTKTSDDSSNVLHHRADNKEPVLFSFRAKNFFGKKKASIRVEFGEWSDKFSLDVAGSSGVVLCRHDGRLYEVAVTNKLTFNSLTKMVIFTPFFLIINDAPFPIECQEMHRSADKWTRVEGKSSTPLWPATERDDKLLLVRVCGSSERCHPFLYTEQHTTTLKLNNDYGGLNVEVQLSEGGTYITLRQYRDGLAPALIINYSPNPITLYEKENVNIRSLAPMHSMLYTWENPAGPRILIFEGHKRKEIENDLRQDGIGEFPINNRENVMWVSFLDGLQRVILLTENELLAHGVHTAGDLGQLDMEVSLSVQGLGLSLVNDVERQEILYVSISNSGILWEHCKIGARRYKKMDRHKVQMYEEAYQRYQAECLVNKTQVPGRVQLDNKIEVDFQEMRQLRPSARLLRRILEPGLWASYSTSTHVRRIHARLHRLQIDQQLPLPTFPVMLAPVPPPRSVTAEGHGAMKPFVEVSIVERVMPHSKVRQYKYYKILVQEFHIKIDMGLVNALMAMFPQKAPTEQEALELFATDIKTAASTLEDVTAQEVASDQKHFYDMLHLSPLKVHVSFSLGGATHLPTFVGTVLQSIGVTLTDMNDVIFKLAYYEKSYEFLSQKELVSQITSHYTGQAIKQLYVLVLGLDVIGNPYGLVIGLKKGVEDLFYEPFQGAIQGPGEFAEGLFLGVRSLVGHTVGGAAGAVSRIAGAMGHGLAALSLDEDFQRRRRENMNKPPANLQEGLARSSKGLVMGVVDGVTGVFTKPISGAREQGVEGFFKGLGKGAVGLVARPTAGVVDFASGSLDAVKRAADMSEEVMRRRPARYLAAAGGVRPYSRVQAEGFKLLSELEKGKYTSTDTYVTHVWVDLNKETAVCTDKRILYLEKNNVFGGWQVVWMYLWSEIPEMPQIVERGVFIPIAKKKVLGMFASSSSGKLILLYDEQRKKHFHSQCERLMRAVR